MFNQSNPLENQEVLEEVIAARQAPRTDADESREEIADQVAEDRDARLAGRKSLLQRLIDLWRPSKG
jgi:hypothetical protein